MKFCDNLQEMLFNLFNLQFVFMDAPEQVQMSMEIVIQPEAFPIFEEIASNTNIAYKVSTDDLQRSEIFYRKLLNTQV